ncbi:glycoside hydrolase family 16 protein [Rhodococcus daqingensis]|uniref:Family 16 glycosylhydrolase n=1 Tax=Rhodococcus daqingensis TaxID=2479363 RepID=A0ABW2RY17_9NOCA
MMSPTARRVIPRRLVALVVALGMCGACGVQSGGLDHAATRVPTPPGSGKDWRIVFAEEFDGTDYDHGKLTPCFDWNYGDCTSSFNEGRETYRPEQVRVDAGAAALVAEPLYPPKPDYACFQGACTYRSGLLSTARPNALDGRYLFPFTYGYVESRMKLPGQSGFFTAFWMLPTDPTYRYRSEIDIVEVLGGDPDTVYMTYAYDDRRRSYEVNRGGSGNGDCAVRDHSRDWVRFGVDWQPDHIAWYIDGVKCGEFTDASQIEDGPMQLIANVMVDNEWEREAGSVLAAPTLVDQLEIDYIRVYQQQ